MPESETFLKTPKGQSEIDSRSGALSMKERRVLILVNGENDAARLQELSLVENIDEVLQNLLQLQFIQPTGGKPAEKPVETGSTTAPSASTAALRDEEPSAREFMCNTLLTFGNRVRVAPLVDQINAADDIETLTNLIKPWYMAISETPGGMYQADDLRKEVQNLIEASAKP